MLVSLAKGDGCLPRAGAAIMPDDLRADLDRLDCLTCWRPIFSLSPRRGPTLTIDHPDEGWTEEKPIPRCPEAMVLEAVAAAVKAGTVWITSGAASVWGDTSPAGIVSKMAVLRAPPDPISVSSLTPEALPDAWTDGKASVHSIEQAVAAQRGVVSLPWKLVEAAITGAMNSGFIRVLPGGVAWPCQPHEAAAVQIGLPEAPKAKAPETYNLDQVLQQVKSMNTSHPGQ